ncbi:MAG: YjbQ family protein [Candidatus Heimdallarchaeota archaeon]|nr:YjbQ family protein [Candidatus Heimdallarchaeota archaeon]
MTVYQSKIQLKETFETEIVNITTNIQQEVDKSGIKNGIATIFNVGSTGGILTLEYEPGLLKDIPAYLERTIPKSSIKYEHEKTWHDDNGHSHVRASIIGPSLTVPITQGKLIHGTWQQVAFMELDTRPRRRGLHITIIGE